MADRISEQTILEKVFIPETETLAVEGYGYDGVHGQRPEAPYLAQKVTVVGAIVYSAVASPGTPQTTAKWQCKKVDSSTPGTSVTTWADGDAEFDNVATNLTTLTYL